jgi:hypothetical protein
LGQQKYKPGEWTSTKKGIEVGHLMTKVVVGFLCQGVGRGGDTPSKLMRYHLPVACCFCKGCETYGANRNKHKYSTLDSNPHDVISEKINIFSSTYS